MIEYTPDVAPLQEEKSQPPVQESSGKSLPSGGDELYSRHLPTASPQQLASTLDARFRAAEMISSHHHAQARRFLRVTGRHRRIGRGINTSRRYFIYWPATEAHSAVTRQPR